MPLDVTQGSNRVNLNWSGIDIRFIEWVYQGEVNLQAGENSVRIQIARTRGYPRNHRRDGVHERRMDADRTAAAGGESAAGRAG